jgi:hypothetical protein
MQNGEITESGSHKDLLALNGEYATLYNIQAQAFTTDPTTEVGICFFLLRASFFNSNILVTGSNPVITMEKEISTSRINFLALQTIVFHI